MTTISFAFGFGRCDAMMVEPWGVDMRNGVIAVVDAELCRVQRFDAGGQLLNVWGHFGQAPGEFAHPRDVALGPAGEVYVADTLNNRIQAFAPDGSLLWAKGQAGSAPGHYSVPQGIAFWNDKLWIAVADTGNNRIQYIDQQGDPQHAFTLPAPQALNAPRQLAILDHELFIADTGNLQVKVTQIDGTFARSWDVLPVTPPPPAPPPYGLLGPTGITVTPQQRLFVSDTRNSEIHAYAAAGGYGGTPGRPGFGPGFFHQPAGMANDGTRVAICDSGHRQLVLTDFAGSWQTIGASSAPQNHGCLLEPRHLVVHPASEQVFVVDAGHARVQGFGLDGDPTIAFRDPAMLAPFGIALHDHELLVTDNTAVWPRVYVYDPRGTFIRRIDVTFPPGLGPNVCTVQGIAVDPSGGWLFLADHRNDLVLEVDQTTGLCRRFWNFWDMAIAENTVPGGSYKNSTTDVAITTHGTIVVADPNSSNASGATARLWVGHYKEVSNAAATNLAQLSQVGQIAIDERRDLVYAAANTFIYTVQLNGMSLQQHLGSGGAPGRLRGAGGVALTPDGSRLYVSEWQNRRVQAFDITH